MDSNKYKDIDFILNWSIEILTFFSNISLQDKYYYGEFIKVLRQPDIKKNKRGLRMSFQDVNEMAYDLDPVNYAKLNGILKAKFGIDLEYFNKKTRAKIKAIIKRGFIRNDEEFYMMKEWIDRIMDEEGQEKEAEIMDKLLFDYEMSKGRS